MRRLLPAVLLPLLLLATPARAQVPAAMQPAPVQPAPVQRLVEGVQIPYERFTLPNGLTVLVHTDRKAPVVAVSVWYHVGSKDEPAGQTGFAHLFEHLMFYGSENVKAGFFEPLQQVGATDMNGTTWFDRTNYFETVPTPALPFALFLESDRMGHLLGGIDQKKLDAQRAVVQNEKRQGDNQPYGLVEYAQLQALFPEGHPYRHSTIGSMADLNAASLAQVKAWFAEKYGPNNAVLVLAGDVDVATAKTLVTRYFGDIPRGPAVTPAAAPVPTLPAPKAETIHDAVATTRLYRNWAVPGLTDPELVPLDVFATVLGGLASSRLDNILVKQEKLAVSVTAGIQPFERVSLFEVTADVRPGADPAKVAARLDAIIADLLRNGPTPDEVRRVATREVAQRIGGLESVGGFGGKAVALAEGQLYAGDPQFYRRQLDAYAAATPDEVRRVARKWLSRPVYALTVAPGERDPADEAKASDAAAAKARASLAPSYFQAPQPGDKPLAPAPAPPPAPRSGANARSGGVDRSRLPAVGAIKDLDFPDVTRAALANGIEVVYAQRTAVPMTRVSLSFDAGNAADPKDRLGTQAMTLAMLDEGTRRLNSIEIAEAKERLGAAIGASASMDRTAISLSALSANLAPSLDLFADIVRNPAFDPAELERLRAQQLNAIEAETRDPEGLAMRTLPPLLYGRGHPYGVPFSGSGEPAAVARIGRADLLAFRDRWLRPDTAKFFVVSDRPLAEILPLLDRRFGDWRAPAAPKGTKDLSAPVPAMAERILVLDRPGSPQSMIEGGMVLPVKGADEILPLLAANDVLGGDITARLSMDLREAKGWAYGVYSSVSRPLGPVPFLIYAPVQTDRTGDALAAIRGDIAGYLGAKGTTAEELQRTINQNVRQLPGAFETGSDVLGGMQRNDLYGRPDDYYDHLADRYRALTAPELDRAARAALDPKRMVWVVVGDARVVEPQLKTLGLPVEVVRQAAPAASAKGE